MCSYRIGELDAAHGAAGVSAAGVKAARLDVLARSGFRVPPGVVVSADEVWTLLLPDRPRPPALDAGIASAARLRSAIWAASTERLADRVANLVVGLRPPFAVRSSSALEDGTVTSAAGMFTSLLHVTRDDLADAVTQVWASGFSALALAMHESLPADHLAVIVQEQVDATVAGVGFSVDPARPWSGELVVECVGGLADGLLDGTAPGERYVLDRATRSVASEASTQGSDGGSLSAERARVLASEVVEIEELFGHPVDVEFAFDDGDDGDRPWIVQARPVTALNAVTTGVGGDGPARVVDVDDVVAAASVATGDLVELIAGRTDKRHYVRMAARRRGFLVAGEWLIAASPGPAARFDEWLGLAAAKAAELVRTEVVELAFPSGRARRVRVADIADVLRERLRPGDPFFVAELYVADGCGFAAIRADDSMILEYLPGAAGGLMFGTGPFSTLVVAADGQVLVDEVRAASSYWALDDERLTIGEVKAERAPEPLSEEDRRTLREIVDGMRAEFGEVRAEWLHLRDGSVMLWDLTVENGGPLTAADAVTVAPGRARGTAVVLPDVSALEAILDDRSVIPDRAFYTAHESDRTEVVRRQLLGDVDQPIVVTPRPKTALSLLIGHVSGFVFDEAASLSHLPIILRELGIPAVREADATVNLASGQTIEIGPSGLEIHE